MENQEVSSLPQKGFSAEYQRIFSMQDLEDFARLSSDDNPIHTDPEYAAQTSFGKPVVHGVLLLSMFSRIFGNQYPGEGSVYLAQSADFLRPAYPGQQILARVVLDEIIPEKRLGIFRTECFNEAGKRILSGRAEVLFPERFFPEQHPAGKSASVFLRRSSV